MWWTADEDISFPINYTVDGEFVVPTSAWATVRDHVGTVMTGLQDVALSTDSTSTSLTIPAVNNTLPLGKIHENRYVVVTFLHGGQHHKRELSYKIRPFVTLTATTDDVRRELGLDPGELPDAEIDLYWAYLQLNETYAIQTAMVAGDQTTLAANQAVAVKAAVDVMGSLAFRVAIKMKAENSSAERMSEFDPDVIRLRLGQRLAGLIDIIEGVANPGTVSFRLATPTDVITGG